MTDLQECPDADIAIASLIIESLKLLVNEKYSTFEQQSILDENRLYDIFDKVIRNGEETIIEDTGYLTLLGITKSRVTSSEIWEHFFCEVKNSMELKDAHIIQYLLEEGSLTLRIIKRIEGKPVPEKIVQVYKELAYCLQRNIMF